MLPQFHPANDFANRSELCIAVESMFSYAYLYRFYGVNDYADRAERAAFNALPVALSPDCMLRTAMELRMQ